MPVKAKRQVIVLCALEVKAVGVEEDLRVAICRSHYDREHISFANELARDLKICGCSTRKHLYRWIVAQKLLDGGSRKFWTCSQQGHLIRVPEERQKTIA